MILADNFEAFVFEYPAFDLLLAAADFEGLVAVSDSLQTESRLPGNDTGVIDDGLAQFSVNGIMYQIKTLSSICRALGVSEDAGEAFIKTLFLVNRVIKKNMALLINKDFDLTNMSYSTLRLLPACLRNRMAGLGLVGVHFTATGRMQLIVDPFPEADPLPQTGVST
jgi:hypothetical protein